MENEVKLYIAHMEPCPFCGYGEQTVLGVRISSGWRWTVSCRQCMTETGARETEQSALDLWQRRIRKEAEVNDEAFDLWCACRQRFVDQLTERIESR